MKVKLPEIIEQNISKLSELCSQFGVERMYAFGSVVTDKFDPEKSDLDFIVELEKMTLLNRGEKLISLWEALEDLFSKKVDLITDQPIKNQYLRASIEKTKQLIYDRESEKVLSRRSF